MKQGQKLMELYRATLEEKNREIERLSRKRWWWPWSGDTLQEAVCGIGEPDMTKLLVGLTLILSASSALANPIPTLTEVFLNDMWGDGIEQISCVLAGPNTARREAEGQAACFWLNPERAIGTRMAPWNLIPIIESYADRAFQRRLPWVRDDQVELEGEVMRGLAQGTETVFGWGDDGMAVWIFYGVTPDSDERHVLVFNYYRPSQPSPEDD